MIKALYNYRELLKSNIKKEIRGKYKGSFLGILWSFVNPLLSVLVYALVFPFILKDSPDNYLVYLIVGILPWTFFTTVVNQGTFTILGNAGIIKKVYFPREILPISVVASGLVNFMISCLIIVLFLLFTGIGFSWYLVFFPLIVVIQCILSLGIIFITGAINVYVRDAEYIIVFILNILFYATPILYDSSTFGNKFQWIFKINPMAIIINGYRDIFFYKQMPDIEALLILLVGSIALLFVGIKIFRKLEKGFAEEV